MSTVKDAEGRVFDPQIHQAWGDGRPRINKAGQCYAKGRRGPSGTKAKPVKSAPKKAAPPVVPAMPVSGGVPVLPPVEMTPATEAEILGEFPKPTVAPGGNALPEPGESAPKDAPDATGEESAAPPQSQLPPAENAAPPGAQSGLTADAFAGVVVQLGEGVARGLIDPEEWKFDQLDRDLLTPGVRRCLEKWGGGLEMSPEMELFCATIIVTIRRWHLPKTSAALGRAWGWFKGLFFRRAPAKPAPESAPDSASESNPQPVAA